MLRETTPSSMADSRFKYVYKIPNNVMQLLVSFFVTAFVRKMGPHPKFEPMSH